MSKTPPTPTTERDSGTQGTLSLSADAALKLGVQGNEPGLSLSELSESDSDTIDVSRIIQSSDMLRSRLSRFIVPRQFEDDNDSDSNSIVPILETQSLHSYRSAEQLSSELSACEPQSMQIGWNPLFLNNNNSRDLST
ncbi:hypothetical protein IWW36_005980, partial [Coemansia brasiliensis]